MLLFCYSLQITWPFIYNVKLKTWRSLICFYIITFYIGTFAAGNKQYCKTLTLLNLFAINTVKTSPYNNVKEQNEISLYQANTIVINEYELIASSTPARDAHLYNYVHCFLCNKEQTHDLIGE